MKLRTILSLLAITISQCLNAQPFNITGTFIDSKDTSALPGVTITLTLQNDSSKKSGTATDADGNFSFSNLDAGKYILRASYIGYNTFTRELNIAGDMQLGRIEMSAAPSTLENVTVQSTQIRAQQLGDTTQFNANAFKTNPDANAEDLVTKMPGITTQDGKLKAGGEDVKQILVDGQPFFGDDPTTAIKNLPAEVIDKIQVFDRLSDQSQFTGFDDGNAQKTINIVTKAGKNNGQFGKVYAGYGTDNRYLAGGNVNLFKGDTRVSIIGLFNNINQQNFASEDLLGVVGGSSGQTRGGGGSQRGGFRGRGGDGGSARGGGSGDASNFLVGQQGGITTTNALGINYSDNWSKKMKVTGSYFFNATDNNNNTTLARQYLTARDSNLLYNETSSTNQKNQNHRANLRLEYTIDSFNSLILTPRFSYQTNSFTSTISGNNKLPGDVPFGNTLINNASNNSGYTFGNNLLYRHRFQKKGRTISLNVNTQLNEKTGDGSYRSQNQLPTDTSVIDQRYDLASNGYTIAPSVNYTEPISKNGNLQINYSPSFTNNKSDKETFNRSGSNGYNDFDSLLSNKFDNTYTRHRGGIGYRYNNQKTSFSLGLDGAYATLNADQTFPRSFQLSRTFANILPNAMYNYRFSRTSNIRVMYRTSTDAPGISQLQNVVDISNPLLLKTGNPDLQQSYSHRLIVRYGNTDARTARSFFAFAFAEYQNNYIGNATYIPAKDSVFGDGIVVNRGSQISLPVNLDGYINARTFLTYGLPVKAIKSNLNFNAGFAYSRTPGIINYATNLSNSYTINGGLTLSSNINENIDFTLSYNGNYNTVINTFQTQANNSYYSQNTSAKINWMPWKGLVLNTNLTHTLYSGLTQSFNQQFLLWNASVGYKFLKNRALEAKVSVYDILNQNRSIARTATETYIEDSYTDVLRQYFMFHLTYTLRRFKG